MKRIFIGLLLLLNVVGCANHEVIETMTDHANQDEDLSLLSPKRIVNIAHRGASGHAPEHTLVSYETSEEMTGDYLEIDLQMTKDNQLIAMHDAELSRTTDGDGFVKDHTIDEIKILDAGTWFNEEHPQQAQPVFNQLEVPTLDDILERFGTDTNYYIEIKTPEEYPDMVEALISMLDDYHLIGPDVPKGKVIIQSFSEASLREVKKAEPSLPLIQLISYNERAEISQAELARIKEYAVGIGTNYKQLNQHYVQKVRATELLVHPYTVNEKKDMRRLIKWGVTGMFTDYPDRLDDVITEIQD